MANLIPTEAKRQITLEYWIRVASVWLCLLGAAALTIVVLNVPSYLLIQNQLQAFGSKYANASMQQTSFEKVETDITRANNAAVLLASTNKFQAMVPVVEKIEALTNEGIELSDFTVARKERAIESVEVRGVARDRESLVLFSNTIEADEDFVSADLPLSNLAKDSDIPFLLSVVLSKQKTN